MATLNYIPNIPNAAKTISSLRHLDYNNIKACSDIVDNSIDAGATQIWIDVLSKEKKEKREKEIDSIIISDNGIGMSYEILDEALKLGSETEKNSIYDLGLYGMGLITASISMGTTLEVLSKSDGELLKSVQDLKIILEKNEFVKLLGPATKEDEKVFSQYLLERISKQSKDKSTTKPPDHLMTGTIVILKNLDNIDYNTTSGLVTALKNHIAQTYRKFIRSGKVCIYVQGEEVSSYDPIFDFEPTILYEESIPFEEGSIKLIITELKDYGASINKEKGLNIANQGFYVLRNNREIITGETFGLFPKHNDLNLLRIEFIYPGSLDKILSSNFSKSRIKLNQSIYDMVARICNPYIKQVRSRAKIRQSENREHKEDFSPVEKYITQKAHLLKRPPVDIEEREPKTEKDTKHKEPQKEGPPRLDIKKRKRVNLDNLKVKFRFKSLTEKGPVYDADKEREVVVIYWNTDHPFYKLFIEPNSENPDIVYPIYFLVYSLGNAELISGIDSDTMEIINNIRYDVGRNLAVLLKD